MDRKAAIEIKQSVNDLLEEIEEKDPDETEFWTELYWRLKDMISDIEEYYS